MIASIALPLVLAAIAAPAPDEAESFSTTIYFASGSSAIERSAEPLMAAVLHRIAAQPYASIRLDGHTDTPATGSEAMPISRLRAERVRDRLVAGGADPARIQLYSHGVSRPALPVAAGASEPLNRRVEVTVRWR